MVCRPAFEELGVMHQEIQHGTAHSLREKLSERRICAHFAAVL